MPNDLFKDDLFDDADEQITEVKDAAPRYGKSKQDKTKQITCLGKTFETEDERREYFRNELREKLPELKKIEGYPIGEDDDIINLSDPPYYTACPNPWLNDFIQEWEQEKVELEEKKKRKRDHEVHTPYASDVSEGKTNPIYKAHSYHTKVPHLAIMRYILHYTQPGDIVFDGFAGTGMTGVAAQFCEKANVELKHQIANEFEDNGSISPKWGERKAICNDLSPIASFIAYNFNTPVDTNTFKREGKRILEELEKEIGWMYETDHLDPASGISTGKIGRIDYTVWSEVLSCPSCMGDVVFTDAAMDAKSKNVSSALICPHCSAEAKKEHMDLQFETFVDPATNMPNKRPKRVPTLIVYRIGKEVFSKVPDQSDLSRLKKIEQLPLPHDLPIEMLPDMQMTRVGRMRTTNTTAIHNMYLPRAAQAMGELWKKSKFVLRNPLA
jgi:rubredoxin